MEPLTLVQKIVFAGVLLFVLALAITPFFSKTGSGRKQPKRTQQNTIASLMAH